MGLLQPSEPAQRLTLAHPDEPATKPRRTTRTAKAAAHWPPPVVAEESIRRILAALSDAREAAGWPAGRVRAGAPLDRKRHGYLAMRLHQLTTEGEANPEALLVAVFKAKVHEHKARRGEDDFSVRARAGQYANAVSLCRDSWWDSNLDAGRAWLASGGRPTAPTTDKRGSYVPKSEVAW